jgi:branched-subunit amino acid aminotransferase/4-amino-4-deoxychorismate lyase
LAHPTHFTAMQVRGGRTPGLDFHLTRLDAASAELFGVGLDGERVRGNIRSAVSGGPPDTSVRVSVFRSGADDNRPTREAVRVVVSVRPPAAAPARAQHLQSVRYQRPLAHIKHGGGFGQSYFGGLAHGNGFDEALFVGPDGAISEGSITNIGFIESDSIVWPDAPALRGVMMQVLQRELTRAQIPWRYDAVRLSDLGAFTGAFVTNSHGMAAVARIDDRALPTNSGLMRSATELVRVAPLDPI